MIRARTLLAPAVASLTVAGLVASLIFADPSGVELFAAFGGIGAYLAVRRPTSSVGWFLWLTGCGLAIGSARLLATPESLLAGAVDAPTSLAAWANGTGWTLAFFGFSGVVSVFPSGRLPVGRAGRWARLAMAAVLALAIVIGVAPTLNVTPAGFAPVDIRNPAALFPGAAIWQLVPSTSAMYSLMFAIVAAGVLALLRRYRLSVGIERLQYRWLVFATVFVAITTLIWAIATIVLGDKSGSWFLVALVAYTCVPVAIGIAVLRYRLYEIDRIISRTLAYAIITAILGAVFAGLVVGLQALAAPLTENSALAVAGSTLAVAALFGPLRRRVQTIVDRRFDRARYDAARVADAFGSRLRDRLDLDDVRVELASTTQAALRPTSVSVWLRATAGRPDG